MDIELRSKVDLFSENYRETRRALRWDGKRINIIEALLYGRTDREMDFKKLKKIRDYLEAEQNEKNIFTKKFNIIFSLLIDESKDYKKIYENTIAIYEHLTSREFLEKEVTAFSSLMLANRFYGQELGNRVLKLIEIKNKLNRNNYIGYALLAATDKSVNAIVSELNEISQNIKQAGNYSEEIIESIALSLILEDKEAMKKVEKTLDILCNIKSEKGMLPSDAYTLIGIVSAIVKNPMNFSKEIKDVYDVVNKKRLFKLFMKDELKILISMGIVLNMYIEEVKAELIDVNFSNKINIYLTLEESLVFAICAKS